MIMLRGSRRAALPAVAMILLAGCSGGGGGAAQSSARPASGSVASVSASSSTGLSSPLSSDSSSAPSSSVGASASTSAGPAKDPGRVLTADEAEAALPVIDDLPLAWDSDPLHTVTRDGSGAGTPTVVPAKCASILLQARQNRARPSVARAAIDFKQGADGPFLGAAVRSDRDPYPQATFARYVAAVAACPSFRATLGAASATYRATVLPAPALGTKALSVRIVQKIKGITITMTELGVIEGHNVVSVGLATLNTSKADPKLPETLARAILARLRGGAAG